MNISGLTPPVLEAVNRCKQLPFKYLLELVDLWKIVQNGGQSTPPEISFDEPIAISGRLIYRPTYAVFRFLDRINEYIEDSSLKDIATFWALENGRKADSLKQFHNNYEDILEAYIEEFCLTPEELQESIEASFSGFPVKIKSLSEMEEATSDDGPSDVLANVSGLVEAYGRDFEYWIYDFSVQGIVWLSAISAGRHNDPEKPNPECPQIVAERNFMNRKNQLLLEYGNPEDPMVAKLIELYGEEEQDV